MRKVLPILMFCLVLPFVVKAAPQYAFDNSNTKTICQTYTDGKDGRVEICTKEWGIKDYDKQANARFAQVCQEMEKRGFAKSNERINWKNKGGKYKLCGIDTEDYLDLEFQIAPDDPRNFPMTHINIPEFGKDSYWSIWNNDENYIQNLMSYFNENFYKQNKDKKTRYYVYIQAIIGPDRPTKKGPTILVGGNYVFNIEVDNGKKARQFIDELGANNLFEGHAEFCIYKKPCLGPNEHVSLSEVVIKNNIMTISDVREGKTCPEKRTIILDVSNEDDLVRRVFIPVEPDESKSWPPDEEGGDGWPPSIKWEPYKDLP